MKLAEINTLPSWHLLITAVDEFESNKCADVQADNVPSTEARQSKCNEALVTTRSDLGSLYFSAQIPD